MFKRISFLLTVILLASTATAHAASRYWVAASDGSNYSSAANWSARPGEGDSRYNNRIYQSKIIDVGLIN
jgi:hypothetical protein